MQADDYRIDFSPVVALKQVAGRSDSDFNQQIWILRIHARDQCGKLRSRHMVADADGKTLAHSRKNGECAVMCFQELACMLKKGCALRRELHIAGCPLDKPKSKPVFEALQFQADCGLRYLQGFRRTREAAQLDDKDESFDGIQVKGGLSHFKNLSML